MGYSKKCDSYECERAEDNCIVVGLAKLHNFCIVEVTILLFCLAQQMISGKTRSTVLCQHWSTLNPEALPLNSCLMVVTILTTWATMVVTIVNDVSNYMSAIAGRALPRDSLHSYVASVGFTRPSR
jgi:hypothetical protein